eukprot:snap_masked-scaffold_16-processed-gene-4.25-mRNA-1 protein AED:1.00 eAED:1.00 QI:0/0/0/0/1/1/3/0/61
MSMPTKAFYIDFLFALVLYNCAIEKKTKYPLLNTLLNPSKNSVGHFRMVANPTLLCELELA